jgi:hypothetical protein
MQAPASAKTEVEGRPDAVRLSAEEASVSEVLAALAARFNLTYTPSPEFDRAVGGVYSGTLQQVLARILDGHDYVANFSVNGIEIQVLGRSGTIARPSDVPPLPGPATAASQIPPAPPVFNPGTPANPAKSVTSLTGGPRIPRALCGWRPRRLAGRLADSLRT